MDNPNTVLQAGIAEKKITSTTVLKISTPPSTGGGTSNIAFLQGNGAGPNASAAQMDATFWIEQIADGDGKGDDKRGRLQLQYTQLVLLNFNGLSWPHVSVATLVKQDEA